MGTRPRFAVYEECMYSLRVWASAPLIVRVFVAGPTIPTQSVVMQSPPICGGAGTEAHAQDVTVAARIEPDRLTISESIELYAADLRRRKKREISIKRFNTQIARCASAAGWSTVADITYASAAEYLDARAAAGWSGATLDSCVSPLRCFGEFLRKRGHLPNNPLEELESSGEIAGDGARALTPEEARAMIAAAWKRCQLDGRTRCNRAVFWTFLFLTGLRSGDEARQCRWKDVVDLEGERPRIVTDPAWSKNRKREVIALAPELRDVLLLHRGTVRCEPTAPVFPAVPNRETWHKDREYACVALADDRGREATPHGARKSFATWLDQPGTPRGVVERLLRHRSSLTFTRYVDHPEDAEVAAVQRLPRLWVGEMQQPLDTGAGWPIVSRRGHPMIFNHANTSPQAPASKANGVSASNPPSRPGLVGPSGVVPPIETAARPQPATSAGFGAGNGHCRPSTGPITLERLAEYLEAESARTLALARLLRAQGADDAENRTAQRPLGQLADERRSPGRNGIHNGQPDEVLPPGPRDREHPAGPRLDVLA